MTYVNREPVLPIQSILICDDDPDDLDVFIAAVKVIDASINIQDVRTCHDLFHILDNFIPDLIFLDLDMPQVNGLQCIQLMKANTKLNQIPIIIFSSTSRQANISTAYEIGADLFFIKPSNYMELINAVAGILKLNWRVPSNIKEQHFVNGNYMAFK